MKTNKILAEQNRIFAAKKLVEMFLNDNNLEVATFETAMLEYNIVRKVSRKIFRNFVSHPNFENFKTNQA